MNGFTLFILLSLVSCANFVNGVHRQIDREELGEVEKKEDSRDAFAYYRRQHPEKDKRPVKNPVTYSVSDGGPSGQMRPPVKRDYRPQRYKANDFQDNDSDGSLWANQGSSSSLFTYQNDKHTGDMVIINVMEALRNQISSELKTAFQDPPKRNGSASSPAAAAVPTGGAPSAAPSAHADEMDMKIYDKISGTVTEEISKDYIVLRGRKEVIYKKEKRSIEVQALVSRKDIMENDYVNSDKLLESKVFILRTNQ